MNELVEIKTAPRAKEECNSLVLRTSFILNHIVLPLTSIETLVGENLYMINQINTSLINSLKENDRAAQRQLYEMLFSPLFSVCKRYCVDHDEAMSVLNEGFFKALKNIHRYEGKGSFEAWIRRIVVNTALDNIRSKKSYKENIILHERIDIEPQIEDDDYSFEIEPEKLYALINLLPSVSKTVFNLYVFEDYTHKEIAEELKISVGTSKWHLANARNKLKVEVEKILNEFQLSNA